MRLSGDELEMGAWLVPAPYATTPKRKDREPHDRTPRLASGSFMSALHDMHCHLDFMANGEEVAAGTTRVTTVFILAESHGHRGHNESEGNSECLFHFCVSLFIRTRVRFQRCEHIATPVYATSF